MVGMEAHGLLRRCSGGHSGEEQQGDSGTGHGHHGRLGIPATVLVASSWQVAAPVRATMKSAVRDRFVASTALLLAASCAPGAADMQHVDGETMGSTWSLKYFAPVATAEVRALVEQELAVADRTFSRWREDSEIVRINAMRSTEPIEVSEPMAAALGCALELARRTGGAFDPTVGPVTELYRKARKSGELDREAVARARPHVGWQKLAWEGGRLSKADPDVQLDLDGIVAGLVADSLAVRLEQAGVRSFFLDVTGEILVRGTKADGAPWRAGIVDPERAEPGDEGAVVSLPMGDMALCTSGSYRNQVVSRDAVVHHIFDPRTGANAAHRTVSASVLARSAALADGLGTALMVNGPEGAEALLEGWGDGPGLAALLLVQREDGTLQVHRVNWPKAE